MHNWSYGHQTSMNLNFLEILLNYLKHVYYHHKVIPQLFIAGDIYLGLHISYITTREQTLERCPNLALASAFFAPGTKGPFSPGW